jgi:hypothetical protein
MAEYINETYGVHRFYIPEGMYSIADVEELLDDMKKQRDVIEIRLKEKNHG